MLCQLCRPAFDTWSRKCVHFIRRCFMDTEENASQATKMPENLPRQDWETPQLQIRETRRAETVPASVYPQPD